MFDLNNIRQYFEGRVLQILGRRNPKIPVQCINLKPLSSADKQKHWARVAIRPSISSQITVGSNPLYRFTGQCYVEIFSPKNSGTAEGLSIISDVFNAFKTPTSAADAAQLAAAGIVRPPSLEIRTPDWSEIGDDYDKVGGEENVYRQTIILPFQIDYRVNRDVV